MENSIQISIPKLRVTDIKFSSQSDSLIDLHVDVPRIATTALNGQIELNIYATVSFVKNAVAVQTLDMYQNNCLSQEGTDDVLTDELVRFTTTSNLTFKVSKS